MKKLYFLLLVSLFIFGCEKEKKSEFPLLTEAIEKAKKDTPQTEHEKCINGNFYPACKNLAFLYEYGGKFNHKITIEKDLEKANFYNKILCEKYKKEYYCKN